MLACLSLGTLSGVQVFGSPWGTHKADPVYMYTPVASTLAVDTLSRYSSRRGFECGICELERPKSRGALGFWGFPQSKNHNPQMTPNFVGIFISEFRPSEIRAYLESGGTLFFFWFYSRRHFHIRNQNEATSPGRPRSGQKSFFGLKNRELAA